MRLVFAAVILFCLVAPACDSGGNHEVPVITSARAIRDVVDGEGQRTSTVEVKFDRPLEFAPRRVPLESLFELQWKDPTAPDQKTVRQQIARAIESDDERSVALHITVLVPDGADVHVRRSAFRQGEEGDLVAPVGSDLSLVGTLLGSNAFAVTTEETIAGGDPPAVADADRDPAAMRAALEAHLERRKADDETRARTLATFDAMSAALVPSPKARAALAALTGTFAEAAIDYLLTGNNCTGQPVAAIVFQVPPGAPQLFARVTFASDGKRIVSLNPIIEGEPIERLMPILAHEAIHCDEESGIIEEVAATAFDSFLYVHLLATDPALASADTPLGRDENVDAIAMINSGRLLPESLGILPSAGIRQALPGTDSDAGSFAALVAAAYSGLPAETPPEALAQAYVGVLAQQAGTEPGGAFNLTYLDQLLGRAADPLAIVTALDALRLVPVG